MFEVDIGTVAVPAKNWYDFMGAENGESRTNYLTLAVQAYFSEEYLQILLIILPYTLIRTGFFKKKMRLADIQSFLSSLAIARLSWEAPHRIPPSPSHHIARTHRALASQFIKQPVY